MITTVSNMAKDIEDYKQYDLPRPEKAPLNEEILEQFARGTIQGDFLLLTGENQASQVEAAPGGTVVTLTGTQTLTNKTLTLPIIASISNGGTVTLPAGTRTLVARDTTDTLTNKTIDGDLNTFQDIPYTAVTGLPTADMIVPFPAQGGSGHTSLAVAVNTTAYVSRVEVPARITIGKLSIRSGAVTTPGTVKVGIYSADGQTQHLAVTSGTLSAAGLDTVTGLSTTLNPGIYYIVVVSVGTFNGNLLIWTNTGTSSFNPASEPVNEGTLTVTASTLPATFTPTGVTYTSGSSVIVRLDN